jgi:hypothetical protein
MQRKMTKKALGRASVPLPEGAQAIEDQLVQGPRKAEAIEMLSGQLKFAASPRRRVAAHKSASRRAIGNEATPATLHVKQSQSALVAPSAESQ